MFVWYDYSIQIREGQEKMEFFSRMIEFFSELVKNEIFIQCFGFLGTACVVIGMQCRSYNKILLAKCSNSLFAGTQYLLFGRYDSMLVSFVAIAANIVYFVLNKKKKNALPFQIAFGVLFVLIVAWQWKDWTSIFVLVAKVLSTVSLGFSNTKIIRILNLISTPCWLAYNSSIPSIAGICSDLLMLTSLIIALIRIDIIGARKEKAQAALAAVADAKEEKETEV